MNDNSISLHLALKEPSIEKKKNVLKQLIAIGVILMNEMNIVKLHFTLPYPKVWKILPQNWFRKCLWKCSIHAVVLVWHHCIWRLKKINSKLLNSYWELEPVSICHLMWATCIEWPLFNWLFSWRITKWSTCFWNTNLKWVDLKLWKFWNCH